MSSSASRNRRGRVGLAALAIAAIAVTAPAAASAAAAEGSAKIVLSKQQKGNGLVAQGIRVSPLSLPVADLELGQASTIRTDDSLKLSHGKRSAQLRELILRSSGRSTTVSAKLGKGRLVVFRAKGQAQVDGTSLKLDGARLSLTGKGAGSLKEVLGLEKLTPGRTGTLSVDARLLASDVPPTKPNPDQPKQPDPDPNAYPYGSQCPVSSVKSPGFGTPPAKVAGIAAAPTFSAGASQPATGTSIEWGFLADFRNYVLNVPTKGSLQTVDGASSSAAGPGMAAPGAFFSFPVDAGTYEPGAQPDHSDDRLVADGDGAVLFCKSGHGFNIVFKNPTVTVDGENSRLTADVGVNMNGAWQQFQRVDIAELDLSSVEPQIVDGGNRIAWEDIPVEMSADGAAATGLGDQYPAGTPLDPITVETALDRPLLAACGVAAGIAAPAGVDFTLAALPTLSSPVVRSGKNIGTINWGFRRATRGTVASPGGAFLPMDGASEGFPGSMGGGNSLPPGGGIGKFFRFPISSYDYEAGTADPGDDRLIATSNATVGFCKNNTPSGNFGLIISKPTLIVDGANSRIVANAYSFSGPFMATPALGWAGGRVELVNLNTSSIDTTTGVGTVRWGEVNPDFEPLQNGIPVNGGLQTEALSLANLTEAGTAAGGFDPVAAQIVLPAP